MIHYPIIGITAEWNPFHRGHAAMIQQIKEQFPQASLVSVMSGSFVQRGEPALFDKWSRTHWALKSGVHAVFELPVLYALQSADIFSSSAVTLLSHTGADCIAFGTESLSAAELKEAARWAISPAYQEAFHQALQSGISYGEAAHRAMTVFSPYLADELAKPNNLLGFRYTETIFRNRYPMDILVIHRDMEHNISATDARRELQERHTTDLLPLYAQEEAAQAMAQGCYTDTMRYEDSAFFHSRCLSLEELQISGLFREGLENKWFKESSKPSYGAMLDHIKSKRYLYSHLKRIGAQLLLSPAGKPSPFAHPIPPGYLRLLGLQREKSALLRTMTLPVFTSTAKALRTLPPEQKESYLLDIKATDLRAYAQAAPAYRKGREDFYHSPIIR